MPPVHPLVAASRAAAARAAVPGRTTGTRRAA